MTGAQLRMARAALKLGVREIAAIAKVSPNTVTRIEADLPANASTISAIRSAIEAAGVIFVDENGEGPGVRLRKQPAPAALDQKIEALEEKAASLDVAGAPSPRKAMNQLKKALVENEKAKLENRRAKAKRTERP